MREQDELLTALRELTEAVNRYTQSNMLLIDALLADEIDEDVPARTYLDGTPVK